MNYLYYFNVTGIWKQIANFFPDLASFLNVYMDQVVEVAYSDDWQIRVSFVLFLCTLVNIVLIGLAWRIFGDSITNIFYNKPKSPARTLNDLYRNDETLSQSMEELFAKKIQ